MLHRFGDNLEITVHSWRLIACVTFGSTVMADMLEPVALILLGRRDDVDVAQLGLVQGMGVQKHLADVVARLLVDAQLGLIPRHALELGFAVVAVRISAPLSG